MKKSHFTDSQILCILYYQKTMNIENNLHHTPGKFGDVVKTYLQVMIMLLPFNLISK
jgi:hypothetical protein